MNFISSPIAMQNKTGLNRDKTEKSTPTQANKIPMIVRMIMCMMAVRGNEFLHLYIQIRVQSVFDDGTVGNENYAISSKVMDIGKYMGFIFYVINEQKDDYLRKDGNIITIIKKVIAYIIIKLFKLLGLIC